MAALIKTGYARSLFQNPSPVFGFGIDQLGDLPLPHQSWRMGPGGRIGKQHLHITGAHIFAADFIGTADITRNPANDIKHVGVVET